MIVHLDVGDDNDNVKLSDIGYDTHAAFHNHKRDRPKRFWCQFVPHLLE